jgi:hypothetical protein
MITKMENAPKSNRNLVVPSSSSMISIINGSSTIPCSLIPIAIKRMRIKI